MSAVILATDSTDLARRVRLASEDRLTVIRPEQVPVGPAQLLALAREPESVTSVILDVRGAKDLVEISLDLANRFEQQYSSVGVMLVSDEPEHLGLRALRSGVTDVLDPAIDIPDLRWALRRAEEAASRTTQPRDVVADSFSGRVVTVASPKGGVGKTTVSTNIARVLAEQSPTGTVLVDLDLQFGDVAAALNLQPDYTMGDILDSAAMSDPITLKTLLTRHPSGLQVACGVKSPIEAEKLKIEKITQLLATLRREFRYVVLDTAPGMSEQTLAALDHTTDLVLVSSLDVPSIRGLHKELEVLDQLALPPHTRHVIVNNTDRLAGLTIGDVESAIGRKVDLAIPRSAAVLRSTNIGSPIVESAPRDRVSKDLRRLVSRFSPAAAHRARERMPRGRS